MGAKITIEIGLLNALYLGNLLSKEKGRFKDNSVINEAIAEFIEVVRVKRSSRYMEVVSEANGKKNEK